MSVPAALVDGIVFRLEAPGDAAWVHALLQDAFGGSAEAVLVDRLRSADELVLALVAATATDAIVGYVGFPRLGIETGDGMRAGVALAPLAVASSHRRRGIGAALVRAGLDRLVARREEIVFVLGDLALYGRFGFSAEDARAFASPYAGPHFMARRLAAGAPGRGRLRYPAAFDALG